MLAGTARWGSIERRNELEEWIRGRAGIGFSRYLCLESDWFRDRAGTQFKLAVDVVRNDNCKFMNDVDSSAFLNENLNSI